MLSPSSGSRVSPGNRRPRRLGTSARKISRDAAGQERELSERVVGGVPVDVLDTQLGSPLEIRGDLFGRTEQRAALVQRIGGDVAVHLQHDRQRVRVVARGHGGRSEGGDALVDRGPVEDLQDEPCPDPSGALDRRRRRGAHQQRNAVRPGRFRADIGFGGCRRSGPRSAPLPAGAHRASSPSSLLLRLPCRGRPAGPSVLIGPAVMASPNCPG